MSNIAPPRRAHVSQLVLGNLVVSVEKKNNNFYYTTKSKSNSLAAYILGVGFLIMARKY